MYLLAETDAFGQAFGRIVLLLMVIYAARKWSGWLKGNDAVKGAAKKGAIHLLTRWLKK